MSASRLRSYIALALPVLLFGLSLRAEQFSGSTYIDFEARGNAYYNMSFGAGLVVGGSDYANAYSSFGDLSASSYSYIGEASAGMTFSNIHKVGSQWVAESVTIYEFSNDTGNYDFRDYYDWPVPSASYVYGYAQCAGYSQTVQGSIDGYETIHNEPPVAAISVGGHNSGDVVSTSTYLTLYFSATDPNSNLSGIRYNLLNATTGYYDNGGGGFVAQGGSSGQVVKTLTLGEGDWYFWTEAQDDLGLTASTPSQTSGFKITVAPSYCTPAYEPDYWNSDWYVQRNNNCYNYSNNRRTDTFAQPGRAHGFYLSNLFTASDAAYGATLDGLEATTASAISPFGKTKLALVYRPYRPIIFPFKTQVPPDYHWYRQDSNGRWSHKIAGTPATNLDNSGRIITNPQTANRGLYTQFVGYYFTPSDCVQGAGHADIY